MAYDAESDRVIMFGGLDQPDTNAVTNDTWAYDYNTNTWTDMAPNPSPRELSLYGLAYDEESDLVVLFGGSISVTPEEFYNETWTYDFNTNAWTNVTPATSPIERCCHSMVYDAESDRIVLFGGYRGVPLADTWAYDANTNTWTQMSPSTSPPSLSIYGMTYDGESDRVITFGGFDDPFNTEADETWAYDLNVDNWTNMNPDPHPSIRSGTSLTYDVESDLTILVGGFRFETSDSHNDTWTYDYNANTWTDMNVFLPLPDRDGHGAAYDSESDRTVMFAGWNGFFALHSDTWAYHYEPNAPTEPLNLFASEAAGLVHLDWSPPATDAGSAITGYRVHRGTTSGDLSPLADLSPSQREYDDFAVTNGVTYYYTMSAINGVGEGPQSNEASATPVGPPTAPLNLQATSPDSSVELSWQAPASDGGSAITNYRVHRGTTSGSLPLLQEVGPVLSFTDNDVVLEQAYYYAVSAVNAEGRGPQTAEVSITPTDTTEPSIAITSPQDGATVSSVTMAVSGTASDNVALDKVEVSLDQASWVTAEGTTSWSADLDLAEGSNTIYARATDSAGNSQTASISVTVSTFPTLVVAIGAGVAAVVVAVTVILLLRRRGTG